MLRRPRHLLRDQTDQGEQRNRQGDGGHQQRQDVAPHHRKAVPPVRAPSVTGDRVTRRRESHIMNDFVPFEFLIGEPHERGYAHTGRSLTVNPMLCGAPEWRPPLVRANLAQRRGELFGEALVNLVGSYELLGPIAVTNSGQRWRGRDTALGRDVLVRQVVARAIAAFDQPRSGVRVLAGLSHPNIVALLDKFEADGQVWLVDEPVDGVTLDRVLGGATWPTPQQSLGVVRGVLKGLAYVHTSRAIHGDVNPSTILVDRFGTTRLTDFGLPVPPAASASTTAPSYLSPEAASGLGVSARSDVYSVAAVLSMLLRDDVDPRLRPVLDTGMARDPTERFLDAEEFLQALEDAAERAYGEAWLSAASVVDLVVALVGD
jgi:Protein kinase domain